MDRYFYSIEDYGHCKEVCICGNVYFNDADETETNYRIAEWTGFSVTISELRLLLKENFFDYINEKVNYLGNITKIEAENMCNEFWNGEPSNQLDIRNVNDYTECGYYWFDVNSFEESTEYVKDDLDA